MILSIELMVLILIKGHIKGSFILDIDKDLSSPTKEHGGKNPLQDPLILKEKLEKWVLIMTLRL